ncbi:MAG: Hsp70 family protein [Eubacteriales bacterium]
MKKIIGIDLGTSTSEISILKNGHPTLIPNKQGEFITPSVVGKIDNDFIVGSVATQRQLLYPHDTALEIKRNMGSCEPIYLSGKSYTAVELSAEILKYLKASAEIHLKESIEHAVITVPAYFTNAQRNATMEAGRLAGFTVERIINEPTAAALSFGIDHLEDESKILVYDLGGGTFDVTLLEMFDGVLEVQASSGNNQLGGKEFDQKLIDYLLKIALDKYHADIRNDIYAMVKLREAAIQCKIALSTQDTYEIVLPMLAVVNGTAITFQETVTRETFEHLIKDLVDLTHEPINTVLQDSNCMIHEVDLILLVGGSTKIPYVEHYVESIFQKTPEKLVDPDLAVALGAAVQAGILNDEISQEDGIMLIDVSPYALGIQTIIHIYDMPFGDHMDVIIPRNTTIPISKTSRYTTSFDNQSIAKISVYQGDSEIASENILLGNFDIGTFPRGKAGKEHIEVTFSYDLNGILVVTANIVSTGKTASISLNMNEVKEPEETLDLTSWQQGTHARKFRSTIRKAERMLTNFRVDIDDHFALEDLLDELKKAIILDEDIEDIEDIEFDILDLLDEMES